jgi:hypothetical protein
MPSVRRYTRLKATLFGAGEPMTGTGYLTSSSANRLRRGERSLPPHAHFRSSRPRRTVWWAPVARHAQSCAAAVLLTALASLASVVAANAKGLPPVLTHPPNCRANVTWQLTDGYGDFEEHDYHVGLFMYGKQHGVPWWTTARGYLAGGASGGEATAAEGYEVACQYVRWRTRSGYRYENFGRGGNFIGPHSQIDFAGVRVVPSHRPANPLYRIEGGVSDHEGAVVATGTVTNLKTGAPVGDDEVGVYAWPGGSSGAALGHECAITPTNLTVDLIAVGSIKQFGTEVDGAFDGTVFNCFSGTGAYELDAQTWQRGNPPVHTGFTVIDG